MSVINQFEPSTFFPSQLSFNTYNSESQQEDWPLFNPPRTTAWPSDYYDPYSYPSEGGYINPMALVPPESPQSVSSVESCCNSPEATSPTTETYQKRPRSAQQSARRSSTTKQHPNTPAARKSKRGTTAVSVAPSKIAHNLVERKYRDTLNAELERLRQAVPHMAALGERASKAAILASAVGYIARLEAELARLGKEVVEGEEVLRPRRRSRV